MATYLPPKKNTEFIFYVALTSRASRPQFQANPTLAAGDVKVSTDGGAFGNIASLPAVTPAAGIAVKVTLSASEMNGDNVDVTFIDAAGAEWDDLFVSIQTSARQVDDLAFPVTSGRGIDVDASGGVEVGSFQAGAITAAAIATDAIDADALADGAITAGTFAAGAITATVIATDAIDDDAVAANAVTAIQSGLATSASISALNNLSAAQVNTEVDTALADVGVTTIVTGRIDAAISTRASQTSVDTIDDLLDLEVAAIKSDTAAILADTGTDGVVVAAGSKTGYSLAATGLDSITATDPAGVASTFPQMVVQLWRRFFKKTTLTSTQIKTYGDDGTTVRTTQTVSDDSTTQTQGAAS